MTKVFPFQCSALSASTRATGILQYTGGIQFAIPWVFSFRTSNLDSIQPLAWVTIYCASNCTDFSDFIFAIKQGGLEKTLEVYNSLIAQLA